MLDIKPNYMVDSEVDTKGIKDSRQRIGNIVKRLQSKSSVEYNSINVWSYKKNLK